MKPINTILTIICMLMLCLASCTPEKPAASEIRLTGAGADATAPFLTKDNKGNPVICWAEKSTRDSLYRLSYAVYDQAAGKFGDPVPVGVSRGMNTAPESMGKIAFRSDNSVIAVFAKAFKQEKNPFAGAIYYSSSANGGKSWSDARFLHSDTSHAYGRSFFDITTLKTGEVAAIWLDGRFGKKIKGSGLFYAATGADGKFTRDTCLYKGTCECCRTEILQDDRGNIHIAYRSILFPARTLGQQVRDMVYSFSGDNGKTFSPVKAISNDNWAIEGCPHTGPSLAVSREGINAVWYTAGGDPGIYYTAAPKMEAPFRRRRLVSPAGKHPQLIALTDGTLAMVCEEGSPSGGEEHHAMGNMMHHPAAGNSRIVMQVLDKNGSQRRKVDITRGQNSDHHAVIIEMTDGVMIAWVREQEGRPAIYYTIRKQE